MHTATYSTQLLLELLPTSQARQATLTEKLDPSGKTTYRFRRDSTFVLLLSSTRLKVVWIDVILTLELLEIDSQERHCPSKRIPSTTILRVLV